MTFRGVPTLVCIGLLLTACRMNPTHEDRPARVVNPSTESRAELQRVVSDMLHGADVKLADDALTTSSVLIVERRRHGSLESPPLSGRDLGHPERFQLVTAGKDCVLVHETDRARRELPETECVAE
jgi:hypothetical protein